MLVVRFDVIYIFVKIVYIFLFINNFYIIQNISEIETTNLDV